MEYKNVIEEIYKMSERIEELYKISEKIYPIGSIYMSANDVNPSTFIGGTWEQIKDTFLLCSGDTYTAGSTGGEATHTLSVDETPAHTHTRGTMNITGSVRCHANGSIAQNGADGAFYNPGGSGKNIDTGGSNSAGAGFNFDASRSWTGETSSVGGSQAHNNMPPYLTVYCWKRIA